MLRHLRSPRTRAMLILGVAGLAYVLVFWLAGAFGLFDRTWGKIVPVVVGVAIVLAAYKRVGQLLSGGDE